MYRTGRITRQIVILSLFVKINLKCISRILYRTKENRGKVPLSILSLYRSSPSSRKVRRTRGSCASRWSAPRATGSSVRQLYLDDEAPRRFGRPPRRRGSRQAATCAAAARVRLLARARRLDGAAAVARGGGGVWRRPRERHGRDDHRQRWQDQLRCRGQGGQGRHPPAVRLRGPERSKPAGAEQHVEGDITSDRRWRGLHHHSEVRWLHQCQHCDAGSCHLWGHVVLQRSIQQ